MPGLSKPLWVAVAGVVVLVIALFWREREIAQLRSALRAEQARRVAASAPAVPAPSDPRSDRRAEQLRGDIAELKKRAAARVESDILPDRTPLDLSKQSVPAALWRNRGRATPAAVLETALWASVSGDIDTLAGVLSMDPVVRTKANALLLSLPASFASDFRSPERMIAATTAARIPPGNAQLFDLGIRDTTGAKFAVVLSAPTQASRSVAVNLKQDGEGWRLVVSAETIEKFRRELRTPGAAP